MIDKNEVFNTKQVPDNIICKNCKYKIGKTNFSNDYHKAFCAKYEYPDKKPYDVLIKHKECSLFEEE